MQQPQELKQKHGNDTLQLVDLIDLKLYNCVSRLMEE